MKVTFRFSQKLLATFAMAFTALAAQAQQPLDGVKLAEPIAAQATEEKSESTAAPAASLPDAAESSSASAETKTDANAAAAATDSDAVRELVKERYSSGATKIERETTQDAHGNYLLHGVWRLFDEQGRLIVDGQFSKNQKVGLWRKFFHGSEAPLFGTAPYKDFTAPFISTATFHANALHGKWTMSDAKQRTVHEIEFCDGQRHGKAIWYYSTGAPMLQARYEDGRVNGEITLLGADGSLVGKESYQAARKLAPKTDFYDLAKQVKKNEITFLHAMLVVKTQDDWDTATLATFESRGEDERHGPYSIWYSNGQLARQGEFRYNLPVGKLTLWYDNGQKKSEGTYVDGRQEGVWAWWHDNGQKAITGEYHDGIAVGNWSWWNTIGKIAQQTNLSHDRPGVLPSAEETSEPREARQPTPGLPLR